jgi:hypothetical protein
MELAQDRAHWRRFVNIATALPVLYESRAFSDRLNKYKIFKEDPVLSSLRLRVKCKL